jgi:hypothetical protein
MQALSVYSTVITACNFTNIPPTCLSLSEIFKMTIKPIKPSGFSLTRQAFGSSPSSPDSEEHYGPIASLDLQSPGKSSPAGL